MHVILLYGFFGKYTVNFRRGKKRGCRLGSVKIRLFPYFVFIYQTPDLPDALFIVFHDVISYTRNIRLHFCPAKRFIIDHLTNGGFHQM